MGKQDVLSGRLTMEKVVKMMHAMLEVNADEDWWDNNA